MDLFLTTTQLFTSHDVNWWTGVVWVTCGLLWCFYQLFGLSFWRHPFTAEHPLVTSKWCNAIFLQIWWRNNLIYILDGLRMSTSSSNKFWVNYSFVLVSQNDDIIVMFIAAQLVNTTTATRLHIITGSTTHSEIWSKSYILFCIVLFTIHRFKAVSQTIMMLMFTIS